MLDPMAQCVCTGEYNDTARVFTGSYTAQPHEVNLWVNFNALRKPRAMYWFWHVLMLSTMNAKNVHPYHVNLKIRLAHTNIFPKAWGIRKTQSLPTTPEIKVIQETSKTQRAHEFRTTLTLEKPSESTQWPSRWEWIKQMLLTSQQNRVKDQKK